MDRLRYTLALLAIAATIPATAQANGYRRWSNYRGAAANSPYGPVFNPALTPEFRQAGGNIWVYEQQMELRQEQAMAREQQAFLKQQQEWMKKQEQLAKQKGQANVPFPPRQFPPAARAVRHRPHPRHGNAAKADPFAAKPEPAKPSDANAGANKAAAAKPSDKP